MNLSSGHELDSHGQISSFRIPAWPSFFIHMPQKAVINYFASRDLVAHFTPACSQDAFGGDKETCIRLIRAVLDVGAVEQARVDSRVLEGATVKPVFCGGAAGAMPMITLMSACVAGLEVHDVFWVD